MNAVRLAAGDWFAIPLRFALFAVGRAAVVDGRGAILGYFFGRFFERLPAAVEMLALTPGEADLIGVCDDQGLRSGAWPVVATGRSGDLRAWPLPVFRSLDPVSGELHWTMADPANLGSTVAFEREPPDAGARNWGLAMNALVAAPMTCADVEFALFARFRAFQNGLHRKYIADMQHSIATRAS